MQCTYNVILRRVRKLLLPWKNNTYYILVCACVRAGVQTHRRVHQLASLGEFNIAQPAYNAYAPYCEEI
jgi:hypothetical protein